MIASAASPFFHLTDRAAMTNSVPFAAATLTCQRLPSVTGEERVISLQIERQVPCSQRVKEEGPFA